MRPGLLLNRERLGALIAFVALVAAGLPPTPAVATSAHKTHTDVWIKMSDGVRISANEFIPSKGCPCPVILNQTPYRKGSTPVGPFVAHGYAEVVTDVRGTGSSEGYWDVFGANEQKDGAELVRWASEQPWSNGKVALYGESYMAINQLLTAEQSGTEALKAIFPVIPMSDSYRDVTWSGGAFDSAFMPWWYALVNAEMDAPADYAGSEPQVALNTESQHLSDLYYWTLPIFIGSLAGSYQHDVCAAAGKSFPSCSYKDIAYDGPASRLRSPIVDISKVRVPTFIVGGSWDIFQRGEPLLYKGLHLPDTEKKLMIGPWYHVTAGTDLGGKHPPKDQNGAALPSLDQLALAWYDHWLKGINNGIQNFPNVETYVLGTNKWVGNSNFPMPKTTYRTWYLGASGGSGNSLNNGTLSQDRPDENQSSVLPWLPANGACSRSTSQWLAGLNELAAPNSTCDTTDNQNEAQALTFSSAPFKEPYVLSGSMNARLYTSSSRSDTSIVVTVDDVAPDGSATEITSGSLVGSLRAVSPNKCGATVERCSLYADGQIVEPWHPYTRESQQPMEPDKAYELQIEIFPTTAVLAPGHELRLTIASGDSPHRLDTASTTVDSAGNTDTFYFGPKYPSSLYLGDVPMSAAPWAR